MSSTHLAQLYKQHLEQLGAANYRSSTHLAQLYKQHLEQLGAATTSHPHI